MSKVRSNRKTMEPSGSRLDVEDPLRNSLASLGKYFRTLLRWKLLELQDIVPEAYNSQDSLSGTDLAEKKQLSGQPFYNYKAVDWSFTGRLFELRLNYWKGIGPVVTQLVLFSCKFDPGHLEALLFSNFFPNLKTLVLEHNTFNGFPDEDEELEKVRCEPQDFHNLEKLHSLTLALYHDEGLEDFTGSQIFSMTYNDFFQRTPNINVLNIAVKFDCYYSNVVAPEVSELSSMFRAIVEIREKDGKDKLDIKHLDIIKVGKYAIGYYSKSVVDQFENLRWGLQTLKMDVGYETGSHTTRQILEPCAPHLEELTLFRLPHRCTHGIRLDIVMQNLQILHLNGRLNEDFAFLKYLPSLKILHLFTCPSEREVSKMIPRDFRFEYYDSNSTDSEEEQEYVPPSGGGDTMIEQTSQGDIVLEDGVGAQLEDLQGDFKVEDPGNFRKLTKWLPNVRKLRLPLTKKTFPIVCQRWRHSLRELEIPNGSDLDDEAFTGINSWNWNIASLTKLTHLKLGGIHHLSYRLPWLTVVALNEGILLLPDLHTLTMTVSCSVSESLLELLKQKFVNLELWRNEAGQRRRLV